VGDVAFLGVKPMEWTCDGMALITLRFLFFAMLFMGIWIPNIDPFAFPAYKNAVDGIELFIFLFTIVWMAVSRVVRTEMPHFSLLPTHH